MLSSQQKSRQTARRLNRVPELRFQPHVETLEERNLMAVDPILEWNAVAIEAGRVSHSGGVPNDQPGPVRTARALAIVHAAMYDAWNSIHPTHTPYLLQLPIGVPTSDTAAVAQAARDTLVALYPNQQPAFDAALTETLRRVPNGARENWGRAVGSFFAAIHLANRASDGSQTPGTYVPDNLPGHHQVDPLNPTQGFLNPEWGGVRTFGIPSTSFIPTRIVPTLTSLEYTQAYNQVKSLGELTSATRTTDQQEIGIYWGYDGSPGLGVPPRLYNQIVRTIAQQQENTVAENARLFALVNISMADAGIQSWDVKYRDIFWRPVVGVRRGAEDANPDTAAQTNWVPLGAPRTNPFPGEINFTPPFPAYTSGHATFGSATLKTLANFYQTDNLPFTFVSDEFNGVSRDTRASVPTLVVNSVRQIRPRSFVSLSQASAENAASRIFLGIHWRFDATEGVSAGNRIANYNFDNLLRPRSGPRPTHINDANFASQIDAYLNNTYRTVFAAALTPLPSTAALPSSSVEVAAPTDAYLENGSVVEVHFGTQLDATPVNAPAGSNNLIVEPVSQDNTPVNNASTPLSQQNEKDNHGTWFDATEVLEDSFA